MQLQARLVHAEPGRRVVELSAHLNGVLLGSALGEGATAEDAEDRALARLQRRLGQNAPQPPAADQPELELPSLPKPPGEVPAAVALTVEEPSPDPEDWSNELTQIDLQLRRLGWQRDQETTYLKRAFGHPSRSRLTSYGDLLAYLQALQGLEPGCDPASAPVPLRRRDLLEQCDTLLGQLHWNAAQGRQFLERHFQLSSRQQLSDPQLLQFNMLLESELIGA
jgi:hypothetical protein